MSKYIAQVLLICTICLYLPAVSFAQVIEWPEDIDMYDGDMEMPTLYMMSGEFQKALPELEKQLTKVALEYGKTSLRHLNLQYQQYLCYHFTQQEARTRQVRKAMNTSAVQLPEDSLLRHLLHKSLLDAQLHMTLISGASIGASLSESDDPIVRALGSGSILDPQEINRKFAAGMEISQKYEGDEEAMQEEMIMEMLGQEAKEDLIELWEFAEQGSGNDNEESLEKLLEMEDNSYIAPYAPLLKQLQGLDGNTTLDELISLGNTALEAETKFIAERISQLGTPKGLDDNPTISNSEFEAKMQRFDQLSREERAEIETKLLQKLSQRDQLKGKIGISSHGDVYIQLAQFYEADKQFLQSADFYQRYKDAAVEYWMMLQHELKPLMMDMTEEEDREPEAFRFFTAMENQIYMTSSLLYSLNMRHHQQAAELGSYAYNTALRDKAFVLERKRNLRSSALASDDDYLQRVAVRWLDYRKERAEQLQMGQIDSVTLQRLDLLERELSRHAEDLLQTDWQSVQQKLKPNEAAVEFVSFYQALQDFNVNGQVTKTLEEVDRDRQYAAVILLPEAPYPLFVPLARQAKLDSLLQGDATALAQQVYASRGATPVGATPTGSRDIGQELYSLIWEPLEKYLQKTQQVYYSPTASLHQLAFAALPHSDGLLIDQYDLRQLSSTRQVVNNAALEKPTTAALFGGIQYDAAFNDQTSSKRNRGAQEIHSLPNYYEYLPGTEKEVSAIAQLLENQDISTELFTGSVASEGALNNLYSPSILHIATHGFFLPDSAKGFMMQADQAMLRSGLVFAGVNETLQNKQTVGSPNDGLLLAGEAAQLNLQETQLVVLSACETGLGDTQGSEGVYGLQRAIREAGARYIIMSLWQVPDAPTQQMMSLFYQYWIADQLPIREAFGKAQQDMQQQYAPQAWAGFVLVE